MQKIDIVLQGPLYDYTPHLINHYGQFDFVENIIVSTWEGQSFDGFGTKHPKAKWVFSKDVDFPGIGNVNRQLKSSLQGVKAATNDYVVKARTDQFWYPETIISMYHFFNEYKEPDLKRKDDITKPYNKIFVSGHIQVWNFGTSDHIYWGSKSDLIDLFDIPPYLATYANGDYSKHMRAECYIALNYYAKFDERVQKMLENMDLYCYDNAPKWKEANDVWYELSSKVMKPFKISDLHMMWPKHNFLHDYHWDHVQNNLQQWGHEKDPHYK
jgi:hypothetical protein